MKVAFVAHCPADGVNVYVPVFRLSTTAGLHVPVIPLVDVAGRTGAIKPVQTDWKVPKLNAGVTIGLTVTVKVTGVTHCPAGAVNT